MIISRQTKKAYIENFFSSYVGAINTDTTDRIFDGLETMLENLLQLPANQRESFAFTLGDKFIEQANFILANENLACLSYAKSKDNWVADSVKHELTPLYKEGFSAGVAWSLASQTNEHRARLSHEASTK